MISLPGTVTLKIYRRVTVAATTESGATNKHHANRNIKSGRNSDEQGGTIVTVASFVLTVHADPAYLEAAPCLIVFHAGTCPAPTSASASASTSPSTPTSTSTSTQEERDWEADYPLVRAYLSPRLLLHTLRCADTLTGWGIEVATLPQGEVWLRYRQGIDAIWTGVGLPREEMSYEERLGLLGPGGSLIGGGGGGLEGEDGGIRRGGSKRRNKDNTGAGAEKGSGERKRRGAKKEKALRRAYYRLSLQVRVRRN
jgi:hypothetical protein